MKKPIVNIVAVPDDVAVLFKDGWYETPLCLGLTASGTVVPMVADEKGVIVPADTLSGYHGLFRDEDLDGVIESLPPTTPKPPTA